MWFHRLGILCIKQLRIVRSYAHIFDMKSCFPLEKSYSDPFERTILIANGHELVHIFRVLHTKLGKVLDIYSNVCPLSDLKTVVNVLAQEISHFFIVELKVGDSYKKPTMSKMHTKCNVHLQNVRILRSLLTMLVEFIPYRQDNTLDTSLSI